MTSAHSLVDFLRKAKDENNWDLAEACLAQSEPVLKRIEDALFNNGETPLRSRMSPNGFQANYQNDSAPNEISTQQVSYTGDSALKDSGTSWHMSIEELFPEIFSDFTNTALFDGSQLPNHE